MTGSGMGCPDWPRCFGQWIPPTDLSQLPADYKTRFQVAGHEIADFDAFKTWVEYINRLIGVLIGFIILLTAAISLRLRRVLPRVVVWSVAALVLVIVQGLVGAVVVYTNLHVGMISVHMIIALLILAVLLQGILETFRDALPTIDYVPRQDLYAAWAALALLMFQIVLGTQVREAVDAVALTMGEAQRASWIAELGGVYDVHTRFYYLLMVWLVYLAVRLRRHGVLSYLSGGALAVAVGEVALGLGMHYLGIPPWLQPLHLVLASVLFGILFVLTGMMGMMHRRLASAVVAAEAVLQK
ncbi:MAG: COX15/CtaA family protein [Bacteroidia bacterium]